MNDAKFGHAFNQMENFGALKLKKLFDAFGSFEKAWESSSSGIKNKTGDMVVANIISENKAKVNPEREWQALKNSGVNVITISDDFYPPLLKEIPAPPSLLYFQGDLSALHSNYSVAVVGTRRATFYGLEAAFKLSRDLSLKGFNIISGLALGVDTQAHKGCLNANNRQCQGVGGSFNERGKTFAVLGSGILKIQPRVNLGLSRKIIESGGAIISEYPPLLDADKWTFPQRNRIIAGLSCFTVVVEAPEKSGALITARFALDSNRGVGAVPGEITSIVSKGSNNLLKYGAYPICEAGDVLEAMGIEEKHNNVLPDFDKDELLILDSIKDNPSVEQLIQSTNLDIRTISQKISLLELKGAIKNLNGKFQRIN